MTIEQALASVRATVQTASGSPLDQNTNFTLDQWAEAAELTFHNFDTNDWTIGLGLVKTLAHLIVNNGYAKLNKYTRDKITTDEHWPSMIARELIAYFEFGNVPLDIEGWANHLGIQPLREMVEERLKLDESEAGPKRKLTKEQQATLHAAAVELAKVVIRKGIENQHRATK